MSELERKKVAVLAEEAYEDLELWYPYFRLQEAGAEVKILGAGEGSYASEHDYPVEVDYKVDNAITSNFDGVVVPGGFAPDAMRTYPPMVRFVRDVHANGGVVGTIRHGGWLLISAGLAEDRTCTSCRSLRDDIENAGADWVDREVVRDDRVVTSRSRDDLHAFCPTLIEALTEV